MVREWRLFEELSQGVFIPSRTRDRAVVSSLSVRPSVFKQTRPPWALGPVLRVVPGALAAMWSRKSGLPQQRRVAPHPAAAFLLQRGLSSRPYACSVDAACLGVATAFSVSEHAPLPLWNACLVFLGWSLEEVLRNPPLLKTRPFWRLRSYRDRLASHDRIATLLGIATWSRRLRPPRQGRASRPGHGGPTHCDLNNETGEASQQRQGARRVEETGW
ncbi:hypothetical protein Taro_020955 [Colocasia esculenta]|uniref:Uncharacterized protein n=1 Tax=Colocasia esculenta TaxID=4460 RepID=A0A843V040_COLES|nr:hypothetical protein [Colocasia esculenta]